MKSSSRGRLLLALLLSFALFAASCGDSGSDDSQSSGGGGTSQDGGDGDGDQLAAAECGQLEYDESVPAGGELVDYAQLADKGSNTSFDPGVVQTLDESQITSNLFDGLTDFDFTEKCQPELKGLAAEDFEANDDASEFTFTIKEGLKFSNGEPVLPHNFKQGWERAGSKELGSAYGYLINYVEGGADLQEGKIDELDAIEADDEAMTLKVTLSAPNADFPSIVSFPFFSPITDEELDSIGNKTGWGTKGVTIGNGPFKLDSATEDQVVLVPNEEWAGNVYGDTEVKLDKLTFMVTDKVESAYQAFESGDGQTATIPPGKYAEAQQNYPNTVEDPSLGSYYFDIGFEDEILGGDEGFKLRKAISLAINREEINDKVYEGARVVATGITPPGIPGYGPDICKVCEFKPDEAKKLYDEWKEESGKEITDPIRIEYNDGGGHSEVAQVIQANLKDNLGIETEPRSITEDYFKVIAKKGGCHLCRAGWYADYPTYGNFMVDLFSEASIDGNNFSRYVDEDFEKAIAEAQEETDADKRGELYRAAEDKLINEDLAVIPLLYYQGDHVYREEVKNYDQPPLGIFLWERVGIQS